MIKIGKKYQLGNIAHFYRLAKKEIDLYKFQDYYNNGILQSEGQYIHSLDSGKKNGVFKYYTQNGILETEGNYIENKKNGVWKDYDSLGNLIKELEYKLGKRDGILKLYFPNQKIKRQENYLNGKFQSGKCFNELEEEIKFFIYERIPEFPGGDIALMQFISVNTNYPKVAKNKKITGKVIVEFKVETDGSISNSKVVKSIDPLLDAEAVRVVNIMPKWIPGIKEGNLIPINFQIPFNFQLED